MEKNPTISVIVPVYNAEKYLARCVDSILSQTFTDFELLLIDDGSSDNSGKVCDEYAKKDLRVFVCHKENGGVSSARNLGLDRAKGEWVIFVDADDWILPHTFSECMGKCADCDMLRFGYTSVYDEKRSVVVDSLPKNLSEKEFLKLVVERRTAVAVWGAVYRKDIFLSNGISFDTTLRMGEDWVVLVDVILHSRKIDFLSLPLYQYNKYNENGCVNNFSYGKQMEMVRAFLTIKNILNVVGGEKEFRRSLEYMNIKILNDIISLHLKGSIKVHEFIERRRWILEQSPLPSYWNILTSQTSLKNKIVLLLCSKGSIGYKMLSLFS